MIDTNKNTNFMKFIKICQNTPQLCWGDEWPTLSPLRARGPSSGAEAPLGRSLGRRLLRGTSLIIVNFALLTLQWFLLFSGIIRIFYDLPKGISQIKDFPISFHIIR